MVLDTLLQRIKIHDTVDIFGIVSELRKDRVWMVQTEVNDYFTFSFTVKKTVFRHIIHIFIN